MEKNNKLTLEDQLCKEKEKARAATLANKAKTEFLENIRHVMRTPLMSIVGFAELIKNEATDQKIKEYANNLVTSSQALTNLLNEVLEAIKVSSGEIPILKKKFSLQKKLNDVILLNQTRASHKKIDLSLSYDPAIPNYLIGDSARIHRIVLELVSNALNFTHKGHVKLSAQLAKDNKQDVIVKIIVEDTGIGIPPAKQQDIYLQFKRLSPSYEGIYKGYGLGLAIVKQLVDDLHAEMYVESQIDTGSKFTFVIKLKKALLDEEFGSHDLSTPFAINKFVHPVEFETAKHLADEDSHESYKSRILLIEDNHVATHGAFLMLSEMGCVVDVAEEGRQAVMLAEQNQYDLILMDIGLPDIDGYETAKRIRLNEGGKNHVPIIALTAYASEEHKKYCINIGMNAVLTKPLVQEKAEDMLNSFISHRREKLYLQDNPDFVPETNGYHDLPIFDFELLKEQFGAEKIALEMITLFLQKLPPDLKEIQTTYTKKDWPAVQKLTHKLKGGVSYCATLRLQEACARLEDAIRNGKSDLYETLYSQLMDEVALAEKAIQEKVLASSSTKSTV